MKRVSFALAMLAIASLALGVTGCVAPQAPAPQVIKVGYIAQQSGALGVVGSSARNAVEMAVKEINDAGGVEISEKKYPIELVVADSEGNADVAIAAAQKMITQDGVVGIIETDESAVASKTNSIAENAKTVLIGTGVSAPEFTAGKKYVFRATFSANFQGAALAQMALTNLGAKTAAVLYNSDMGMSEGLADSFKQAFQDGPGDVSVIVISGDVPAGTAGTQNFTNAPGAMWTGKVVAFESYKTGDKDFTAQLTRIKEANPDVLFFPNYLNEVPAQAEQARQLGITAQFLGPESWSWSSTVQPCGSPCDGAYLTTDFRPEIPNPAAANFIARYKALYNVEPESPAALAYDSVYMLARGLTRGADADPAKVREALRDGMSRLPRYEGVTGWLEFKPGSGDPIKAANIMQIKDDKYVYVGNVNP